MRSSLEELVERVKAATEPSRLRILFLLKHDDLTVSELTKILNQSQPRVSRHLKLLQDADLVDRYQEGAWAYFRLSLPHRTITTTFADWCNANDEIIVRDQAQLAEIKANRQAQANAYFDANAERWDQLRSLHVSDQQVETELTALVGDQPVHSMLDLGTGTGRMLVLFSHLYQNGLGIDLSRQMLTIARANLDKAGISHARVQQGDVYAPTVQGSKFDLITIHQVLHYLDNPQRVIQEAASLLRPGGRLLVIDFATHSMEVLRQQHAHLRLGFDENQIADWLEQAGLHTQSVRTISGNDQDEQLAVRLWMARDERMLIANENQTRQPVA